MSQKILMAGMFAAGLAVGLLIMEHRTTQDAATGGLTELMPPAPPAIRGMEAPNFALPNLKGETVHLEDFKGKVVLVNFWATWCHPCLIEIPWFLDFQERYGPQGFEVVGISLDEGGAEDVQPFVDEHKMAYTVVLGDESTSELFGGVFGLPTSYMVDQDGKFYSMHRGLVSKDIVEDEILILLSDAATPAAESVSAADSVPSAGQ